MSEKTVKSKSLSLVEALISATGIATLGAVVASGAAAGAFVEGFKAAGKTVKDVLTNEEAKAENGSETTKEAKAENTSGTTEEVKAENDSVTMEETEKLNEDEKL